MKKLLNFCIAVLVFAAAFAFSVSAAEIIDSGFCGADGYGTNITWTLDSEGTLTLEGTGAMGYHRFIWDKRPLVKRIVISDGISQIENFNNFENLEYVSIPDSVVYIEAHAFSDCKNLRSVTLPKNLTYIGDYAFCNCSSLTALHFPASLRTLGKYALKGCTSLETITVEDGSYKFYNDEYGVLYSKNKMELIQYPAASAFTSYEIPKSVRKISSYAFYGNKNLASITFNDGLREIREYAFSGCTGLTSVVLPESAMELWSDTFSHCTSLSSVTLPSELNQISGYMFAGCTSLTSITIPESVTVIGDGAFSGSGLTSITLPAGLTKIRGGIVSGCKNLTSVTIPPNVTDIGMNAFVRCSNLTSIVMPKSIRHITHPIFMDTPLLNVYFGGTEADWKALELDEECRTPFSSPVIHYSTYTTIPIMSVRSTDIRSYIFGSEIESYNVNGSTCIVAEDLMNYGFTVEWDGRARLLFITHPSDDFTQAEKKNFGAKSGNIGEKLTETVPTDIVTYVNGREVPSYNIDGRTVIYIDSLSVFGNISWDGGARTISLG